MSKYVYLFKEGNAQMKELLGGKGANLCEMTNIGLPVPPGFVITTDACREFYTNNRQFPYGMEDEVMQNMKTLEGQTGKVFGSTSNPLLVSVRSGAVFSMPGMMDTVLNLGLNDETVKVVEAASQDKRFALDSYRRFINMFGDVVMGVPHGKFEEILEAQKQKSKVKYDNELRAEDWEQVIDGFKALIVKETGRSFPQDVREQLFMSIFAVFNSWNTERAIVYRRINKIPDDLGTAVNIQTMVFGNMGDDCGTGVAFTRNPATGEDKVYGEYLINAQGEDVVAGIRTPQEISTLKEVMPTIFNQFQDICKLLEKHYRDMQDIEFTIEKDKLFILQTRSGKRTVHAAIKVAVDMFNEGLISQEEAILRVQPDQLDQLLHRRIDPQATLNVIAKGLAASPGAAAGAAVFDTDLAEQMGKNGEKVILVRTETTPDDIHGIVEAQGILTSRGGMTSHAAVVARGMGKPCVSGCEAVKIHAADNSCNVGDIIIKQGDHITINGSTGEVILGEVPMIDPEISSDFRVLLEWADDIRKLKIRANADTPEDTLKAREFGAEGIGLTRTEHMFMKQERLPIVQRMILAENKEQRQQALDELLPVQEEDFYGILKAMQGYPVTIRLLDPPLHEFLPKLEDLLIETTELRLKGKTKELAEKKQLLEKVEGLLEFNPMLGHRGCRLGITYPEIYEMQARAIFQATARLTKEGVKVFPEVEVPLISDVTELTILKQLIVETAEKVENEYGLKLDYKVGTMIELPRACLLCDEVAAEAEFISFGTNDLTQTTFGVSRDDAEGKFLQHYVEKKVLKDNPFVVLDRRGVGKLMEIAVDLGRRARPDLDIGICGEHGGEPSSVEFCHMINMNYVSCSPFRVPIARLAAAQAAVSNK